MMCLGRDCIGLTDNEPLFRETNNGVKFLKTLCASSVRGITR